MSFQAKNTEDGFLYETPNPVSYNLSGYMRAEKMAPVQVVSSAGKNSKGKGKKMFIPSYGGTPFPSTRSSTGSYASVADSY